MRKAYSSAGISYGYSFEQFKEDIRERDIHDAVHGSKLNHFLAAMSEDVLKAVYADADCMCFTDFGFTLVMSSQQ